jgi:hypothetical protein
MKLIKLLLEPSFCAAVAVLTFALVAAYIPIKPATDEHIGPTIIDIAV